MSYSLPLFHGRDVFQYKFGFLPNRHPIDAYVTDLIEVWKFISEQITSQTVDDYHMNTLTRLFDIVLYKPSTFQNKTSLALAKFLIK